MHRIETSFWRLATAHLALAAAAAVPAGASAQPSPGLTQAIEQAWARQPEARAAVHRREAASAQRKAADAWTAEPVSFVSSLRTDRLTRNSGTREVEIGVAVALWLPGQRARSQALADAELNALHAKQRAALWRVAGAVREAWWAAQGARQEVAAARVRLSGAERLASDVARRLRAGDLARADQHQADAAVAAAQAELALSLAAQAAAQTALRALGITVGDEQLAIDAEAEPTALPLADAQHPAVAEWASRAEAARQAQALVSVQTRGNPEVTLLTTRERGVAGEASGQTFTVGVRVPFGSDDRGRGKAAAAAADLVEAEAALEIERDKRAAEVDAARVRLSAARAALQAQERRAALARETVGFIDKSFRLGQTDLPTRLRIELEGAEAERLAARAHIEWAHAVSALRQALGLVP